MKFETKIFLSIILPIAIFLFSSLYFGFTTLKNSAFSQYKEQYNSLNEVLSSTFREMETSIDKTSLSAVKVLFELEKNGPLPSQEDLKKLASELQVSHFYITNSDGVFIRNTDVHPEESEKGLFDFCDDYRGLLTGRYSMQKTPMLPGFQAVGPYKFTMIPNYNKTRILEVGYHMDYVGRSLSNVMKSDVNISEIGLFSPSGFELGSVSRSGDLSKGNTVEGLKLGISENIKYLIVTSMVQANVGYCCECKGKNITDDSGEYYYYLRTKVDLAPFYTNVQNLFFKILLLFLILVFLSIYLANRLSKWLVIELKNMNKYLQDVNDTGDLVQIDIETKRSLEFRQLALVFNEMIKRLKNTQKLKIDNERNKALSKAASQVAHDICSPLAALDYVVKDLQVEDEQVKQILFHSVKRIQDISNSLLSVRRKIKNTNGKGSESFLTANEELTNENIFYLVESLVSETRTKNKKNSNIEVNLVSKCLELEAYSRIQAVEFARCISNILNNAIDACLDKSCKVEVILSICDKKCIIEVVDNGKGIPFDVLPKVFDEDFTSGKIGGSGLGLYHAKKCINYLDGKVELSSQLAEGTKVRIEIPLYAPPKWLASKLDLNGVEQVVILDDDFGIHETWRKRLYESNLEILSTHTSDEFNKLFRTLSNKTNILFLMDYELGSGEISGLDLIIQNNIEKNSILVTSRFQSKRIISSCTERNIKLLPKRLSGFVEILLP